MEPRSSLPWWCRVAATAAPAVVSLEPSVLIPRDEVPYLLLEEATFSILHDITLRSISENDGESNRQTEATQWSMPAAPDIKPQAIDREVAVWQQ